MKPKFITAGVAGWLLVSVASWAQIDVTNTSQSFSLGYGKVDSTLLFTTTESSSSNTPTGSPQSGGGANGTWSFGAFTFSNIVRGTASSSAGPTFPNRVLSDGPSLTYVAQSITFTNTISVRWTGGDPSPTDPPRDLRIRLNISQISIYGMACCSGNGANTNMAFHEITPGHDATSPSVGLKDLGFVSIGLASSYNQLIWDPIDFTVSGTNLTRTFVIQGDANFVVDGFEIIGNAQFIYNIPEPAAASLLGAGVVALAMARGRGRRGLSRR